MKNGLSRVMLSEYFQKKQVILRALSNSRNKRFCLFTLYIVLTIHPAEMIYVVLVMFLAVVKTAALVRQQFLDLINSSEDEESI